MFLFTLRYRALLLACFTLAYSISLSTGEDTPKRGILLRRPNVKTEKTSTTAAPPAEEINDEEYDNQDQEEGVEGGDEASLASSTTTTSTEPPKKVGPIIRPFRSNDDFLTSLKRRQMNAKKAVPKGV